MAKIDLVYADGTAKALRGKLRSAFNGSSQDAPIRHAAQVWHGRMVRRTPKRWTGQTRRSWRVQKTAAHTFDLTNVSKSMLYLERGTKAHGPKSAKRLFIPLTRRAAQAGAKGVVGALKAWAANKPTTASGKAKKPPYVIFVDFVWAKKVKGIRAMWIVRSARTEARATLRQTMRRWIVNYLK